MRIECEVCGATYTIDDAQLGEQSIGAQCPYCGNVRLVRRADARIAQGPQAISSAPTPLGNTPFALVPSQVELDLGFGSPPPPAEPSYGGAPGYGDAPPEGETAGFSGGAPGFKPMVPPGSEPAPIASSSRGRRGAHARDGAPAVDGMSVAMAHPEMDPSGFALAMPASEPSRTAPTSPSPSSTTIDRFSSFSLDLGPEGSGAGSGSIPIESNAGAITCQVCGVELTDEFDKVIGLCDQHQRERKSGGGTSVRAASSSSASTWTSKGSDSQGDDALAFDASRDSAAGGAVRKASWRAGRRHVRLGVVVLFSLVTVGVAWMGVSYFGSSALSFTSLTKKFSRGPRRNTPVSANPLGRVLADWRREHPHPQGTAQEHLVAAEARHLEDTWKGYMAAEVAYQQAMLIDEDDPMAIAGYVENLAVFRFALATGDEQRLVQAALHYADEISPGSPAIHRAQSAVALARGDLSGCRGEAEQALERDPTDGRAKLLLAGCYLEGNVQLSIEEAEDARRLVPNLRRADRVLATAYAKMGRYAAAFRALDQRLKIDPANAAVHFTYGNVALDLSMEELAREHYRASIARGGEVQLGYLALGELDLEHRNFGAASASFKQAAEASGANALHAVHAFTGWARAELGKNQIERAAALAQIALDHDPRDPSALVVRGEAALLSGSATTAAVLAKRALESRKGEPSALVLAARAAALERQPERSVRYLEEAIQNDPKDVRLKGLLAATYLSLGGSSQAYALMRQAGEIDPGERFARNRIGPLAVSERAVLDAIDRFRRSASEDQNASVANSSMGILYYHLGDVGQAESSIARALKVDDGNITALLYDAQMSLEKGSVERAEASASRMLALERGVALGHLMMGRVKAKLGKVDEALEQYRAALRSDPGLLAANVEMAGLNLKTDHDKALDDLNRAFQLYPYSLITRRLLYAAGQ